jgi:hypothetical protein
MNVATNDPAPSLIVDNYYYEGLVKFTNCIIKDNHMYVTDISSHTTRIVSSDSQFVGRNAANP